MIFEQSSSNKLTLRKPGFLEAKKHLFLKRRSDSGLEEVRAKAMADERDAFQGRGAVAYIA